MVLSNLEYRKAIAFGLLSLLKEWAGKGTLGDHDLRKVIEEVDSFDSSEQRLLSILDTLKHQVEVELRPLTKHVYSLDERRKRLFEIRDFVDELWNESLHDTKAKSGRVREAQAS